MREIWTLTSGLLPHYSFLQYNVLRAFSCFMKHVKRPTVLVNKNNKNVHFEEYKLLRKFPTSSSFSEARKAEKGHHPNSGKSPTFQDQNIR